MSRPFMPGDTYFINMKQVHTISGNFELFVTHSNEYVLQGVAANKFLKNLILVGSHFVAMAAPDDTLFEESLSEMKAHFEEMARKIYSQKKGEDQTFPTPPTPLKVLN